MKLSIFDLQWIFLWSFATLFLRYESIISVILVSFRLETTAFSLVVLILYQLQNGLFLDLFNTIRRFLDFILCYFIQVGEATFKIWAHQAVNFILGDDHMIAVSFQRNFWKQTFPLAYRLELQFGRWLIFNFSMKSLVLY